jgi:hypothetical protein
VTGGFLTDGGPEVGQRAATDVRFSEQLSLTL